jgi:hypothetical protein
MKAKTFLAFYLTFFFLALAGIGLYQNEILPKSLEIVHIGVMIAIIGIGLYQGYLKIKGDRMGQPADDEFSLLILHRSASFSFLFSLYMWAGIVYLFVKTNIEAGILFGTGILGMAVLFALCWLFFKIRGAKNA